MLNNFHIRSLADETVYRRGCDYYDKGAVSALTIRETDTGTLFEARVRGSEVYTVHALLDERDSVRQHACTCPAHELYPGACKHVIALLKKVQDRQLTYGDETETSEDKPFWVNALKRLLGTEESEKSVRVTAQPKKPTGGVLLSLFAEGNKPSLPAQVETAPIRLEITVGVDVDFRADAQGRPYITFRIGRERLYILQHLEAVMRALDENRPTVFGKKFTLEPTDVRFETEIMARVWALVRRNWQDESVRLSSLSYYQNTATCFSERKLYLTPTQFQEVIDILDGTTFRLLDVEEEEYEGHVENSVPPLSLDLRGDKDGSRLLLRCDGQLYLLNGDAEYVMYAGVIYHVPEEARASLCRLVRAFHGSNVLTFSESQTGTLLGDVIPSINKIATVEISQALAKKYRWQPLVAEIYFDYEGDGLAARLRYTYDDVTYNPVVEDAPRRVGGAMLLHDRETEQTIRAVFDTYGFTRQGDRLVQPSEEACYDFLENGLPILDKHAAIFYADTLQRRPLMQMPRVTLGVRLSRDNLLDVKLSAGALDFEEIASILQSYQLKRRYHRMKDGTFVTFGEQQLDALASIVSRAKRGAKQKDGALTMPLANALYLDATAREERGIVLDTNRDFRTLVRNITTPDSGAWEVPQDLQGVLRPYQEQGFRWLMSLAAHGLGGILADDMGLGKTLEVISFLLAQKEDGAPPTLVVTPTSLMYNWLEEIARFAPTLVATTVDGTKEERREKLDAAFAGGADILVTTYNMLKRDIDEYAARRFRYCVLDEAQHIKNPTTQNTKAVKEITAGGYFAVTGTPIENSLTELWSIFDYLMPGYLGAHAHFRKQYETQIVRHESERAASDLRRHIAPFILRRLKRDVLTELPDKVESKMISEMTAEQAKVYQAWFVRSQKEFAEILKSHGVDSGRIEILAILTRLRQIACDPALFLDDYNGGSGKLDLLEDIVTEAVAGGHRLLIFSQFTTMLEHIGNRLKDVGIDYAYLDGATPAWERLQRVKAFNAGSHPVFLLSLKAGGTGLNLTGADMVIHFDPWWNPAVEDQATDRAYRIGQENKVQVIKLVTKDTVEEKIFALQARKKALIDQMIQPGENFLAKLDENDLRDLFR